MPLTVLTDDDGTVVTFDDRTPDEVRADLLRVAEYTFSDRLKLGFSDTATGITVGIEDGDRAQFDQLLAHLDRKGTPPGATVTIFTRDGSPASLTYADLLALLIRAGDAYLALRVALGAYAQTVKLTPDENVRGIPPITFGEG